MYSPRYKFPTEKDKVRSPTGIKLRTVIILIVYKRSSQLPRTNRGIYMFADDTNISSIGNSTADIEVKLNNDLYNVNNWLIANKLTLNVEFMLIASKRKLKQFSYDPCILIGNHNIKQVTNKKVLGITLHDELRWHKHNDLQCKKLSKSIALLRRAKRFVNQNVLINMYNSLVLPHFTYCSNVWN
jgi:hypothetical protein